MHFAGFFTRGPLDPDAPKALLSDPRGRPRRGSTGPDVLFGVGEKLVPRTNGEGRNRTGDTTVFSRVLYRLSYLAA
jgi:hypothetical protein